MEERWPSPMEPLEFDSDRESQYKLSSIAPPPPVLEDPLDDEKKNTLENNVHANGALQDQQAHNMPHQKRRPSNKTHVDLVVLPLSS